MNTKVFAIIVLMFSCTAKADIVVIVNKANNNVFSPKEVSNLFLGKAREYSNGEKAVPVMMDVTAAGFEEFSQKYLGKSGSQLRAYWANMTFTGGGIPPQNLKASTDVVDIVAKNPNLIGLAESSAVNAGVRVVALP